MTTIGAHTRKLTVVGARILILIHRDLPRDLHQVLRNAAAAIHMNYHCKSTVGICKQVYKGTPPSRARTTWKLRSFSPRCALHATIPVEKTASHQAPKLQTARRVQPAPRIEDTPTCSRRHLQETIPGRQLGRCCSTTGSRCSLPGSEAVESCLNLHHQRLPWLYEDTCMARLPEALAILSYAPQPVLASYE